MSFKTAALMALLLLSSSAGAVAADEGGPLCAERPGQTTPPCTAAAGEVIIESSAAAFTVSGDRLNREKTLTVADTLLRIGLAPSLEAQVGWTPLGRIWTQDRALKTQSAATKTGDVKLGLLYGLAGPDGPVAIQGVVTLPAGQDPLGAGDWSAALRLPVAVPLMGDLQFAATPEVDAAVNTAGAGRHLAYGGAVGLSLPLAAAVQIGGDISVIRDLEGPAASSTVVAGVSVAWQAGRDLQFDLSIGAGLNGNGPASLLNVGVAYRF